LTRLFLWKKIKRLIRKNKGFNEGNLGFMRKKKRQGTRGTGITEYRNKGF